MILLHRLKSLVRWVFRRSDAEADLNREMESFVDLSAADRIHRGERPEEARRKARMEMGGIEQTKERVRTNRWGVQLDRLAQDLRYAWRSLARQPGFTLVVVATLALGIGLNTAIFTVVDATILRPLPFREPQRLLKVSLTRPGLNGSAPVELPIWSYPKYETFRQNQQVFEKTALYRAITINLTGAGDPERLQGEEVTASYFPTLGIMAEIGRTFLPQEDVVPERDVAVISHGLWERHFGADTAIIGKTVTLDLKPYMVTGVLPLGFQGLGGPADIWVPVHRSGSENLENRWAHAWEFVARLRPGISVDQAKSAATALGKVVDEAHRSPAGGGAWGAHAEALNDVRVDETIRKSVWVLFGAVTFVLLIACVNVANLLLARASARRREIAIRTAIGAGRPRVIRQLLTETFLLALLSGAASVMVSYASVYALSFINPVGSALGFGAGVSSSVRRLSGLTLLGLNSIRVDTSALLFTLGAALLAGLVFGLAPAWQAARTEPAGALKKTEDRQMGIRFGGKSILVIVEIALAFVLLTGAGLAIESLSRLTATPVGIDANNILSVRVSIPAETVSPAALLNFFDQLEAGVAAQTGVLSTALGSCHALAGFCGASAIRRRDQPDVRTESVGLLRVSPEYFSTMKIPLLRGRYFSDADRSDARKTVIINQAAAERYFPGEDPLGKVIGIGLGFTEGAEIIGIVGNVRYGQWDQPPQPDAYVSLMQAPLSNMYLFVRTVGDPAALVSVVRDQVRTLNRNVPIYDVRTMTDRVSDAAARARFIAILLVIFAAMAIVLAAIGIYGVMSYIVRQRTHDIGIRLALGARSQDVVRQITLRSAGLVVAGTAAGLVGALAGTRVLVSSLYDVKPDDPQTYILMALILAAVALLASYIPARRASTIDPAITLRAE